MPTGRSGTAEPTGRETVPASGVAVAGECASGEDPEPVDCAGPHTVEITARGSLGGALGDTPPARDTVFETVFPTCRSEAAEYLGSAEYDVTSLAAWLWWANEEKWRQGQRWYLCGVAQLDSEGRPSTREGSLRNALSGGGLDRFRQCSRVPPSQDMPLPIPCDQPHRGEAVTVVPLDGGPDDPLPSEQEFEAAKRECMRAVRDHVGADRDDVHPVWRWPDETSWRRGFTNLTCYLETEEPVTASLRDLGPRPLPVR